MRWHLQILYIRKGFWTAELKRRLDLRTFTWCWAAPSHKPSLGSSAAKVTRTFIWPGSFVTVPGGGNEVHDFVWDSAWLVYTNSCAYKMNDSCWPETFLFTTVMISHARKRFLLAQKCNALIFLNFYLFFHWFNKYLLRTHYDVSGIVLGTLWELENWQITITKWGI